MGVNKSYGKVWLLTDEGDETAMRNRFEKIKEKGWRDYRLVKVEVLEES